MLNHLDQKSIDELKRSIKKEYRFILALLMLIIVDFVVVFCFQNRSTMYIFLILGSFVLFACLTLISLIYSSLIKPNRYYLNLINKGKNHFVKKTGIVLEKNEIIFREQIEFQKYLVQFDQEKVQVLVENSTRVNLVINSSYDFYLCDSIALKIDEVEYEIKTD